MRNRIVEFQKMIANLERIDLRERPIVEGKIQLDVIFDGFRIFSMMVLKELGLCYRLLEHFQIGTEMMRNGKLEEFDQNTKRLLEELKSYSTQ